LGVKVTTNASGIITNAQAHGNLWRGFENFLLGREVNDAITFVQRICGVCPVPHGMTSTYAVDAVLGYSDNHITFADDGAKGVPPKAVSIRNLVLGAEFLMSSITHFYHLAAPSYVQGPNMPPWTPYFNDGFYNAALLSGGAAAPGKDPVDGFSANVWSTVIRSYVVALRIRRLTFEAGALFAGRMPMTSVLIGGGVTFDGTENLTARAQMFEDIMKEVGLFVIQEYVPIALALGALYTDYDNLHNVPTGLAIGSGLGRYLAWGAFPDPNDTTDAAALTLKGGFKDINPSPTTHSFTVANKGEVRTKFLASTGNESVVDMLTEDIASSRYVVDTANDSAAYAVGKHPYTSLTSAYPGDVARTKPKRSKANSYTYMKAPRWGGVSAEVGPMARCFVSGLFVDGTPLRTSLGVYYTNYVKQVGTTTTGLNPAMISADIAVCLLRAGLATIDIDGVGNAIDYAGVVAFVTNPANNIPGATPHDKVAYAYSLGATVISGTIASWVYNMKAGASTMDRLRGRAIESLFLIQQILGTYTPATGTWTTDTRGSWALNGWVKKLKDQTGTALLDTSTSTWKSGTIKVGEFQGWGATEAPRGALMHQTTIVAGKITKYQCIVPTTWNGSPVIGDDTVKLNHGAIEASCIDAPLANLPKTITSQDKVTPIVTQGGVEVMRCAQSFDPCIACAIH
jgi:Ni,Fe-hydrogenase I large subunit